MKTALYLAAGAVVLGATAHAETSDVQTDMIPATVAQDAASVPLTFESGADVPSYMNETPADVGATDMATEAAGNAMTTDAAVTATAAAAPATMVTVKLEDGTTLQLPDNADKAWTEAAREKGFDRFTFDPASGLFIVGKGDAKFDKKWDDNGNRIATPKPKVKKAKPVEEAAPAEEAPAADQPTPDTEAAPAEVPASAMPAATPATMEAPVAHEVVPAGHTDVPASVPAHEGAAH